MACIWTGQRVRAMFSVELSCLVVAVESKMSGRTSMIGREYKTARELEALIKERLRGFDPTWLKVRPDLTYGWAADMVGSIRDAERTRTQLDSIERELRAVYGLKQ